MFKDKKHIVYYYDGDYYFTGSGGGDSAGPEIRIEKVEKSSDGIYLVRVTEVWVDAYGDEEEIGRFSVECKITPVNGVRYWTINKITRIG